MIGLLTGERKKVLVMNAIRVLIADDHPVVRSSVRSILEAAADIEVLGEARNGVEALHLTAELSPDVLLLDMEMPGLRGFEVARYLQMLKAPVRILALSAYDDWEYIKGLLDNGAAGYLVKGEKPEIIIEAIRGIARGENDWFSQSVAQQITAQASRQGPELALVQKEQEILKLVVEGQTNHEISQKLGLSEEMVKTFLNTIFAKLGVTSRATAAIRAIQTGLV
jgi:DNA-binding NarL/FixJ family response regulator